MIKKISLSLLMLSLLIPSIFSAKYHKALTMFLVTQQIPIDDDLMILLGAGGNTALFVGSTKLVLIDPKGKQGMDDVFNMVSQYLKGKELIIVNTHFHEDHTGGNALYKNAKIINAASLQGNDITLDIGNDQLHIIAIKPAHTDNDIIVYSNNRNILIVGDIAVNKIHPVFDDNLADIASWVTQLDKIYFQYPNSRVIPGHGAPANSELLIQMKNYLLDLNIDKVEQTHGIDIKSKYQDWIEIPFMSNLEKSIEYIRHH